MGRSSDKERESVHPSGPGHPSFTPIILNTIEQQEALFPTLRERLIELTTAEVFGNPLPEDIREAETLRGIYKSLAKSLNQTRELKSTKGLLVGIIDFMAEVELKSLLDPKNQPKGPESILFELASYFSHKRAEQKLNP